MQAGTGERRIIATAPETVRGHEKGPGRRTVRGPEHAARRGYLMPAASSSMAVVTDLGRSIG